MTATLEWSRGMMNFGKTVNQTTCVDVSGNWMIRGTKSGTVYVYDSALTQKILISSSEFDKNHPWPIRMVFISPNEQYIAVINSNFAIYVLELVLANGKTSSKVVSSHNEHKCRVSAVNWSWDSLKLYSGDVDGCSFEFLVKAGYFQTATHKFVKEKTEIVQLSSCKDTCILSGITRSICVNLELTGGEKLVAIGSTAREGRFGACIHNTVTRGLKMVEGQPPSYTEYMFCARPQSRVWCAEKRSGKVLSTLKFPELTLPGYNFGKILPFGSQLCTWTEEYFSVLDIGKLALLEVKSDLKPIHDVGIWKNVCYIVHGDEPMISRVILKEPNVSYTSESPKMTGINKIDTTSPLQSPIPREDKSIIESPTLIEKPKEQSSVLPTLMNPLTRFVAMMGNDKKPSSPVVGGEMKGITKEKETVNTQVGENDQVKPSGPIPNEDGLVEAETIVVKKLDSKPKKVTKKNTAEIVEAPLKQTENTISKDVQFETEKMSVISQEFPIQNESKPSPVDISIQNVSKNAIPSPKIDNIQNTESSAPVDTILSPSPVVERLSGPNTPVMTPVQVKPQKMEDKLISGIFNLFGGDKKPDIGPNPQPTQSATDSFMNMFGLDKLAKNEKQTIPQKSAIKVEPPKEVIMPKILEENSDKPLYEPIQQLEDRPEKKITKKAKKSVDIGEGTMKEDEFTLDYSKIKKTVKKPKKHAVNIEDPVRSDSPILQKEKIQDPVKEPERNNPIAKSLSPGSDVSVHLIKQSEAHRIAQPLIIPDQTHPTMKKIEPDSTVITPRMMQEGVKMEIAPISDSTLKEPVKLVNPAPLVDQVELIDDEFQKFMDSIDTLHTQMLDFRKTDDQVWFADFLPNLQEWKSSLIQYSSEKKIPFKYANPMATSLLSFWFEWSFRQEEKLKEESLCNIVKSLYQFIDVNLLIKLCNQHRLHKVIQAIIEIEDERGIHFQDREKVHLLLKDNVKMATKFISTIGFTNHSLLHRYLSVIFDLDKNIFASYCIYNYPVIQYWNVQIFLQDQNNYEKYLENLFSQRIEIIDDVEMKIHMLETLIHCDSFVVDTLIKDKSIASKISQTVLKSQKKKYYSIFSSDRLIDLVVSDLSLLPLYLDSHKDHKIWNKLLSHSRLDSIQKEHVLHEMCQYLDSSDILQIINDPSLNIELPSHFFDKIALLGEMEQKQNQLKHSMLETSDTYMWGRKDMISPHISGLLQKNDKMLTFGHNDLTFKHQTLPRFGEEKNHWGASLDPSKKCPSCMLSLTDEIGGTVRLFQCGHGFHTECCGHETCIVCYRERFTPL